ncbi:hypothetical protein EJB05_13092, partial [Eragrostis curvula]
MDVVTHDQLKQRRSHDPDRRRGVESHGHDLITLLPDAILGRIISLLPTKDGARTLVLSSRWRPLWRSAPLNLDTRGTNIFDATISRILSVHRGPCPPLQRLATSLQMPRSTLRFSPTLRIAKLGCCHFRDMTVNQANFPNLEHLELLKVKISEDSMHAMLANSPALKILILKYTTGFSRLKISCSPSLECITVVFDTPSTESFFVMTSTETMLQELIIESAPRLERLLIHAPKLKMLGRLTDQISRLELGATVFQGLHAIRMATEIRSVKILALKIKNLSLDLVIDFLKCFPCVEKLYIETVTFSMEGSFYYKHLENNECLDLHLKRLVLSYYRGNKSYVDFAKLFISKASVLESMKLDVEPANAGNKEWIENQCRQLQLESSRGSVHASIDFTSIKYFKLNERLGLSSTILGVGPEFSGP